MARTRILAGGGGGGGGVWVVQWPHALLYNFL